MLPLPLHKFFNSATSQVFVDIIIIGRISRWNHVNNMQQQKYLKNAYRVLMTRARQGMIIFVPSGTDPEDDPTRDSAYYDDIYKYLRSCGIKELM
ncbi:DUF2075 domain-containing protein [Pseudoflavonifractor phocaeensis]|nr:DUF2075 domain-containing protein [Pseudoflavonifractor phocaeensis]